MAALASVELSSQLSRRTRAETLATQVKGTLAGVSALYGVGDFTIDFIVIGKTLEEIKTLLLLTKTDHQLSTYPSHKPKFCPQ